jgi:glycosyltransferase involved in cell wall biosynthesis
MQTLPISIIMPVRNGVPYITEALASLEAQTAKAAEIIVVDDGSTDATPGVLAEAAARNPTIRLLRQAPLGIVPARQNGIATSQQPLIACLDADDIAHPDRLALQFQRFEAEPDLVLLGSNGIAIDPDGNPIEPINRPQRHDILVKRLARENPFIASAMMFRRSAFDRVAGFRDAFEAAEDYDLWLRLAEVGQVANLPQALISYRVWPGSVSHTRALYQNFAADLARRSAAMRRATGLDPAASLAGRLDWHQEGADRGPFRAEILRYRALDRLQSGKGLTASEWPAAFTDLAAATRLFTRRDRVQLQDVLAHHVLHGRLPASIRATCLWHLLRLGPAKAIKRIYRQRAGPAVSRGA